VLLVFANIFFYHYPISDNASALSVYTSPYNLNFLFGMSAVWLHRRRGGAANFTVGIFISTAVLLSTHLPNKFALILLAIGFALIVAGATALERCGRLRVPSFLVFVGNASYSIYLVHVSFEGLLLKIALNTHYYELMGAGSTYFTVLTGTILIGSVAYFTVERPLLRALQRPGKQISTKHENQLMGTKLTTGCNGIEQRNRE
jgi:peptidoglycan/LPS O-acetylase OafA/YrhL